MGDILHALPAITALRAEHPDWYIGWAVEPRWRALLCAESKPDDFGRGTRMPLVDRIHRVATREWGERFTSASTFRDIAALRDDIRREQYEIVVDLQGAVRSALVGYCARASRHIGEAEPREYLARFFFSQRVHTQSPHVIDQAVEIVRTVACDPLQSAQPMLPRDEYAEAWCERYLARHGSGPFVLMNPGAGWGAKRWPVERFGRVAAELSKQGYQVLINTGPTEENLAEALVSSSGGVALPVDCNIGQLISLTRRASLMIAGDTGPLHLACALGRPVVGIFGPTDPARNGPYGSDFRILRSPQSKRDHTRRSAPEAGLLTITPEAVLEAATALLEAAPRTEQTTGTQA